MVCQAKLRENFREQSPCKNESRQTTDARNVMLIFLINYGDIIKSPSSVKLTKSFTKPTKRQEKLLTLHIQINKISISSRTNQNKIYSVLKFKSSLHNCSLILYFLPSYIHNLSSSGGFKSFLELSNPQICNEHELITCELEVQVVVSLWS